MLLTPVWNAGIEALDEINLADAGSVEVVARVFYAIARMDKDTLKSAFAFDVCLKGEDVRRFDE